MSFSCACPRTLCHPRRWPGPVGTRSGRTPPSWCSGRSCRCPTSDTRLCLMERRWIILQPWDTWPVASLFLRLYLRLDFQDINCKRSLSSQRENQLRRSWLLQTCVCVCVFSHVLSVLQLLLRRPDQITQQRLIMSSIIIHAVDSILPEESTIRMFLSLFLSWN